MRPDTDPRDLPVRPPPARPTWALPARPPPVGGLRRGALTALGVLLLLLPATSVSAPDAGRVALAVSLAAVGLAGLVAAVALVVQTRATGDGRLSGAAAGYAAVSVAAGVRALTAGTDTGLDPWLALLQTGAVPVAVLVAVLVGGQSPVRSAALAAAVVVAVGATALAVAGSVALVDVSGQPAPTLRGLELTVAVLATAAVRLWLRRIPDDGRHGRGWVAAGLVLLVLTGVARALFEQRTGPAWWATVAAGDLSLVLTAGGLGLLTCRPYRRQLRCWRELEVAVLAAPAGSPLLPGPSISPDDDDGLPGPAELHAALAARSIGIALQPVVGLTDGAILGVEALARFGGRLPPDRWFRAARLQDRAAELELTALRSALAYLHELPAGAFLAVNLSPLALTDDTVLAALRAADLSRVVVEVTEHDAVGDYRLARVRLDDLRRAGARIAVDYTGAGFASLRHVLLLQPDVVKLDHSLTRGVAVDPRQRDVVGALVRFAESVGVLLVAEGVESEDQVQVLTELGLTAAQGYHLGVPALQG